MNLPKSSWKKDFLSCMTTWIGQLHRAEDCFIYHENFS